MQEKPVTSIDILKFIDGEFRTAAREILELHGMEVAERVELRAGEMVFIPPMTPYEWWNDDEEPAEAILIFFGEGA